MRRQREDIHEGLGDKVFAREREKERKMRKRERKKSKKKKKRKLQIKREREKDFREEGERQFWEWVDNLNIAKTSSK